MASVRYGKTYNLGNYESERIDFEDDVLPEETKEQALVRVRAWVEGEHQRTKNRQSLQDRFDELSSGISHQHSRMARLVRKHKKGIEAYEKLRDLLLLHGVTIDPLGTFELPLANWDQKAPDDQADDQDDDDQDDDDDNAFD